jgi:hypothetical protein
VLVTIRQWGDEWVVGRGNEPVAIVHTACGERTSALLTCDHCGEQLHGHDVRVVAGPGRGDPALLPLRREASGTAPSSTAG